MDNFTKSALADGIYVAFTDGSCKGNPGPGGSAMRLYAPDGKTIEKTRLSVKTTNNIAEMVAVIDALTATPEGASVLVCLDSEYIKDSFEKYLAGWNKRSWRKSNGKKVANILWWKQIIDLTETRKVTFHKIKAHSGHPENEYVHGLSSKASERAVKRASSARRDAG